MIFFYMVQLGHPTYCVAFGDTRLGHSRERADGGETPKELLAAIA